MLHEVACPVRRRVVDLAGDAPRMQQVVGMPASANPLAIAVTLASRSNSQPLLCSQLHKKRTAYCARFGPRAYMGSAIRHV